MKTRHWMTKVFSISFLWIFISVSPLLGNYKFYNTVKHVLKVYQVDANFNDMHLEDNDNSHINFDLTLNAGRNNFDTVLMVGFLAAGKGLQTVPELDVENVNIRIIIAQRDYGVVIGMANANDILRLMNGTLSAKEFKTKYVQMI